MKKHHAKCAKTPEGREYLKNKGKLKERRAHDAAPAPVDDDTDD